MKHFGSTFILCFLGFLVIQANAIPSWKTCSANSDCQATGEYCDLGSLNPYCWYNYAPTFAITLTSSSVLTYVKQAGYENNVTMCPSFDTCTKNCRKEYSVEKTLTKVTLTSSFADTTDCVCDKVVFRYGALSEDDSVSFISSSTGFGTAANTIELQQYTSAALDLIIMEENSTQGATVDCLWEYSIGTVSSPPPPPSPSPPPSSSSGTILTGLLGLISASVVAFALL